MASGPAWDRRRLGSDDTDATTDLSWNWRRQPDAGRCGQTRGENDRASFYLTTHERAVTAMLASGCASVKELNAVTRGG